MVTTCSTCWAWKRRGPAHGVCWHPDRLADYVPLAPDSLACGAWTPRVVRSEPAVAPSRRAALDKVELES